jgi:hypothetical protein
MPLSKFSQIFKLQSSYKYSVMPLNWEPGKGSRFILYTSLLNALVLRPLMPNEYHSAVTLFKCQSSDMIHIIRLKKLFSLIANVLCVKAFELELTNSETCGDTLLL